MDPSTSEQREELRLDETAAVFLELPTHESSDHPAASVRLLCRLTDASANGLRLKLDRRLPVGAMLMLSARFNAQSEPLRLAAEVRWVSPEDGSFLIGMRLLESRHYDMARWKLLIADRL